MPNSKIKTRQKTQKFEILGNAERRQQAIAKIMREPTVDITTARCALGIGEAVAYREAINLGAQRIGKRFVFPSAKLREILGLSIETAQVAA